MWEDMGSKAVIALANTNGSISLTNDSLNKIKEIKYDDVGAAFEGIKNQLEIGLIIPLGERLLPILNTFANFIYEHMPQIQATFEAVFTAIDLIITTLGTIISAFVDSGISIWNVWGSTIKDTTETNFNLIKGIIDGVLNVIQGLIKLATGIITGDWELAFEGLKQTAEGIFTSIKNLVELSVNNIVTIVKGIGTALYNAGRDIFNSLLNGIKSAWSGITSFVSDKVNWIKNKVSNAIDNVKKAGSHRTGLNEVPFDGYIAELHRGEMVLTQAEAKRYRDNEFKSNSSNVYQVTYSPVIRVGSVRSDKDIKDINKSLNQNIKDFERAIGVVK